MIQKNFKQTLEWLLELQSATDFHTSGYNFLLPQLPIVKKPNRYTSHFTIPAYNIYMQISNRMPSFDFSVQGKLYHVAENESYVTHMNSALINNNCDVDLAIDRFFSDGFDHKGKHFCRYMTPVQNNDIWNDLPSVAYSEGRSEYYFQLLALTLNGIEVHVGFTTKNLDGEKQRFLFIEPQCECTAEYLGNVLSFPIILVLGLLHGYVYLNESYSFQYDNIDMETPTAVCYRSLIESYEYEYQPIVRSAYSLYKHALARYKGLNKQRDSWLDGVVSRFGQKYHNSVPLDVVNSLVNNLIASESLTRALHILMTSQTATLELQPAICAVVMETLTSYVMNTYKLKAPNQISDQHWTALHPAFLALAQQAVQNGDLTPDELTFVEKKLKVMNQPTNADKLKMPFSHFNYAVTPEEFKLAINNRNTLLHGSIGVKMTDINKAFSDLQQVTILFHRLCAVLLLKMAGYDGLIVNYLRVYGRKTRRKMFISLN